MYVICRWSIDGAPLTILAGELLPSMHRHACGPAEALDGAPLTIFPSELLPSMHRHACGPAEALHPPTWRRRQDPEIIEEKAICVCEVIGFWIPCRVCGCMKSLDFGFPAVCRHQVIASLTNAAHCQTGILPMERE